MAESLSGKVILVTGAAKRIGRSIALRLASEGARVLVHYHGSEEEAKRTAMEAGNARLYSANLEDVSAIRTMYQKIEDEVGVLDGVVNNAARFTERDVLEITEDDWDSIHSVNLKSVFFSCQAAARLMKNGQGGKIVNLSSLGGIRPWPQHVHYCASKAGVIHMTRALSVALAPEISVNSVAPGVIPFAERFEPRIEKLVSATPAKRAGTGGDVAEAVVYFLTAPRFITGQVLAVDGGLSQR